MKNESKKRPQSEKTKLLETMGRGCVALKETPEATGQRPHARHPGRPDTRSQTSRGHRPEARDQIARHPTLYQNLNQTPEASGNPQKPDNLRKLRSPEAQIHRDTRS